MNNAARLSLKEPEPPAIRYGGSARAYHPAYPILLLFVLIVGAASLISWCYVEFSVDERAARGEARAQYLLGKRYFDAALSPHDYERAAAFIHKAAQQGYARAETGLGLLYENGLGVPKNYGEALKWLRLAADQGYAVAQNELGVMYARGRGVPRNLREAARWCRLAASQGSEVARRNLQLAEVADAKTIPQLATPDRQIYHRARVQKVESDGITISFVPTRGGFGLAKLKLDNLPSELQQLCKYATKQTADADSAYSQIGSVATTL